MEIAAEPSPVASPAPAVPPAPPAAPPAWAALRDENWHSASASRPALKAPNSSRDSAYTRPRAGASRCGPIAISAMNGFPRGRLRDRHSVLSGTAPQGAGTRLMLEVEGHRRMGVMLLRTNAATPSTTPTIRAARVASIFGSPGPVHARKPHATAHSRSFVRYRPTGTPGPSRRRFRGKLSRCGFVAPTTGASATAAGSARKTEYVGR
jgi:hypothetical protein